MLIPNIKPRKGRPRLTLKVHKKAIEWLLNGQVGNSSATILFSALNMKPRQVSQFSIPYDIPDLIRCHKLVKEIPEIKEYMYRTAKISPEWKNIISNWDWLISTLENELSDPKNNCRAPEAYNILQKLIGRESNASKFKRTVNKEK